MFQLLLWLISFFTGPCHDCYTVVVNGVVVVVNIDYNVLRLISCSYKILAVILLNSSNSFSCLVLLQFDSNILCPCYFE